MRVGGGMYVRNVLVQYTHQTESGGWAARYNVLETDVLWNCVVFDDLDGL